MLFAPPLTNLAASQPSRVSALVHIIVNSNAELASHLQMPQVNINIVESCTILISKKKVALHCIGTLDFHLRHLSNQYQECDKPAEMAGRTSPFCQKRLEGTSGHLKGINSENRGRARKKEERKGYSGAEPREEFTRAVLIQILSAQENSICNSVRLAKDL